MSNSPVHYIIGSGPAGTASAHALIQRGARVVMLDAGVELEKSRSDLVAEMRSRRPDGWSPEQIAFFKGGATVGTDGIPQKLIYGSDYPYREAEFHLPGEYHGVGLRPSLGRGGFSAVWGAAILPYSRKDTAGWPIGADDLEPHYAAVAGLTGLSARHDDLEEFFPLHAEPPAALKLSRQANALFTQLQTHRQSLQAAGIYSGQARLAVQAGEFGCVYCGLCLHGCPYGFIYNTEQTLAQLRLHPNFTYLPDVVVTRLRETGEGVTIDGYHRTTRKPSSWSASRVYVAAGVISTARIVLHSLELYDRAVVLKDSQYFLFPVWLNRRGGDVQGESLHTLSQIFIEIFDDSVSRRSVHLQVYSYNDHIAQAVRRPFGPAAGLMGWLARGLERRLLVVQGYLHSDDSSRISVTLRKHDGHQLQVEADINPGVRPAIHRVLRKLASHAGQIGARPLSPLLRVGEPGRGFHSGGSFPMRRDPLDLETDTLGRLPAWRRIHLVDGSIMPDIPATQITFSLMANAHRIACEAVHL